MTDYATKTFANMPSQGVIQEQLDKPRHKNLLRKTSNETLALQRTRRVKRVRRRNLTVVSWNQSRPASMGFHLNPQLLLKTPPLLPPRPQRPQRLNPCLCPSAGAAGGDIDVEIFVRFDVGGDGVLARGDFSARCAETGAEWFVTCQALNGIGQ